MKLLHITLIVFTGLLFSYALYAQDTSNETTAAAAEAPVNADEVVASLVPVETPFENSPYPIILEKMPFGTPPDLTVSNAPAPGIDEVKVNIEREKLAATLSWTAINITPDGRTAIGFTDLSAKPPANYYMTVGESANNWKVVEADYTSETATIERDGVRISLKFGNKSPITPTTPGAPPTSQPPLGTPSLPMARHDHERQPGLPQPIVETHATPFTVTGGRSSGHSSILTSFRDRLLERNKARENERLETDRRQKEEMSKIASKIVTDTLRKQQEDSAAAVQQQQGDTPVPQVETIEVPVQ